MDVWDCGMNDHFERFIRFSSCAGLGSGLSSSSGSHLETTHVPSLYIFINILCCNLIRLIAMIKWFSTVNKINKNWSNVRQFPSAFY